MKVLLALSFVLGASTALADQTPIYSTNEYKIVSEAPYVDGGTIKFMKIGIEVDSKVMRLAPSRVLNEKTQEICNATEFKHVYMVQELAGFFTKSILLTEQGFEKGKHSTVALHLFCMEEAY